MRKALLLVGMLVALGCNEPVDLVSSPEPVVVKEVELPPVVAPQCPYVMDIEAGLASPALEVTLRSTRLETHGSIHTLPDESFRVEASLLDDSNVKEAVGLRTVVVNVTYWDTWYRVRAFVRGCLEPLVDLHYIGPKNPTGNGDPDQMPVTPECPFGPPGGWPGNCFPYPMGKQNGK